MLNFSDCYIAKVKSFFGLKSIDPPVPFDEFIHNNFKDLQALIKNNQIIVLDGQGNEINILLLEKHIHAAYKDIFKKINQDINKKTDESNVIAITDNTSSAKINPSIMTVEIPKNTDIQHEFIHRTHSSMGSQRELDRLKIIDIEEKAKLEHKKRLLDPLRGCDDVYGYTLENGIERNDNKIRELQEERKLLLNNLSKKTENIKK